MERTEKGRFISVLYSLAFFTVIVLFIRIIKHDFSVFIEYF